MQASRSRRSGRRRHRNRPMAEINVTPFVDVMLVLLIIFMVAAPLLTVGVPLELPRTAADAVPSRPEEPLTLSIPREGPLILMESEISEDELIPQVTAAMEGRDGRQLFLRADSALAYGRVMQVMGALNAAGFKEIVLVTDAGGPALGGTTTGQPSDNPAAQGDTATPQPSMTGGDAASERATPSAPAQTGGDG